MIKLADPNLKNSTFRKDSRYTVGGATEMEPQLMGWWNKKTFPRDDTDYVYVIEKKYEGRPDLLAQAFYDNTYLWWFICQYNAILDFNTEFVENTIIKIPTKKRVTTFLNSTNVGGIKSQRTL